MERLIQTFADGSKIVFDSGSFDNWCVYLHRPNQTKYAPTDTEYFSRLQVLGQVYGHKTIYDDYVVFYNLTNTNIEKNVLDLILSLSSKYGKDSLEIAIWFTVIYAGMVAEENKVNAILKKRIKRLGMHQTLIDKLDPRVAANFSRGKKWRELDLICRDKGF